MYKVFGLIILLCSCSSNPLTTEEVRVQEYGDLYFTMVCWWGSQESLQPAIFWCTEDINTELISGYVSIAIEEDLEGERFLSICGRDVTLNTGYDLHDNLIAGMTEYAYNCFDSYERSLGNEFDWLWEDTTRMLQLIWRPEEAESKVLTLFVEEEDDSPRVLGSVYYKTLVQN